jgi:hypothetical protein
VYGEEACFEGFREVFPERFEAKEGMSQPLRQAYLAEINLESHKENLDPKEGTATVWQRLGRLTAYSRTPPPLTPRPSPSSRPVLGPHNSRTPTRLAHRGRTTPMTCWRSTTTTPTTSYGADAAEDEDAEEAVAVGVDVDADVDEGAESDDSWSSLSMNVRWMTLSDEDEEVVPKETEDHRDVFWKRDRVEKHHKTRGRRRHR